MAATPAEAFPYVAPEYAADPAISFWLGEAANQVDAKRWGSKYGRGVAYLAAHLLAVSKRGSSGAGGPVIMEKLGDMQQQYASGTWRPDELPYASTTYGREFISLRRQLVNGPVVLDGN